MLPKRIKLNHSWMQPPGNCSTSQRGDVAGDLQQRKAAAVLGAVVADAAAQPSHWVYDLVKLGEALDPQAPEFHTPSINPYYRLSSGANTCYGDQLIVVLESLVQRKGVDIQDLERRHYERFGPSSCYENEVNSSYTLEKNKLASPIASGAHALYPIHGPWRHKSIKEFVINYKQSSKSYGSEEDDQIDGAVKIVPVVARYAGGTHMLQRVEDVVRVTQNNDMVVSTALAAARIFEKFLLTPNLTVKDIISYVIDDLFNPSRSCPTDLDNALASQLKDVLDVHTMDHRTVVTSVFKNN